MHVLHTNTSSFNSVFSSKEGVPSLPCNSKFSFSIPERIRNFLAITYLDNFRRTCHVQVAWTLAILFSAILVFPLSSTIKGHYSRPSAKNVFCVSVTKSVRPLWENVPEKWCWKPDYELHLRKMDGGTARAVIIQLKLSFGIWKQTRVGSQNIGRFPTSFC